LNRDIVEEVLNLVNCKVLQYAQSATTDTYVLSESSMFIFRTHFVLKTCGETTLLHAVQPILELAREYCGFDVVDVRRKMFVEKKIDLNYSFIF
jgi:S-adenosylmethionine decarboxylase